MEETLTQIQEDYLETGLLCAREMTSADFVVKQVDLEKYIGERGGEIRQKAFRKQFRGKTTDAILQVGRDIDAVSGATISSKAMTKAVRQSTRWLRSYIE